MTAVLEPASAIAASLCLTGRTIANGVTDRHPRPCAWCDWPLDELRAMVDGFNAWAGYDERHGTYGRHEARLFVDLPRAEQQRLITAAQAFEAVQPEPASAPVVEEEGPSWMHS